MKLEGIVDLCRVRCPKQHDRIGEMTLTLGDLKSAGMVVVVSIWFFLKHKQSALGRANY
jgi:hypothetical protein